MKRKIENFIFDTIILMGLALIMIGLVAIPPMIENFFNSL